jgi:hypothetical protein
MSTTSATVRPFREVWHWGIYLLGVGCGTYLKRAPPFRALPTNSILAMFGRAAMLPDTNVMTRQQILDLYFMDARWKLIDIAAFIDRVERVAGEDDFRITAFRSALLELSKGNKERAKQVLLAFSDPTTKPIEKAAGKGAVGAYNPVIGS